MEQTSCLPSKPHHYYVNVGTHMECSYCKRIAAVDDLGRVILEDDTAYCFIPLSQEEDVDGGD